MKSSQEWFLNTQDSFDKDNSDNEKDLDNYTNYTYDDIHEDYIQINHANESVDEDVNYNGNAAQGTYNPQNDKEHIDIQRAQEEAWAFDINMLLTNKNPILVTDLLEFYSPITPSSPHSPHRSYSPTTASAGWASAAYDLKEQRDKPVQWMRGCEPNGDFILEDLIEDALNPEEPETAENLLGSLSSDTLLKMLKDFLKTQRFGSISKHILRSVPKARFMDILGGYKKNLSAIDKIRACFAEIMNSRNYDDRIIETLVDRFVEYVKTVNPESENKKSIRELYEYIQNGIDILLINHSYHFKEHILGKGELTLAVGNGKLDNQDIRRISYILTSRSKILKILDFTWQPFGKNTFAFQKMITGLEYNTTLTSLNLDYSKLGEGDARGLQSLANVLRNNSTLETLKLNWCDLDESSQGPLITILTENRSITDLGLGANNNLWKIMNQQMILALQQNKTLYRLYLGYCHLSGEHKLNLFLGLINNRTLTSLSLPYNNREDKKELSELTVAALQQNKTLTEVVITDNEGTIRHQFEEVVTRNRGIARQQASVWAPLSVLIGFQRANRTNALRNSILTILPYIRGFSDENQQPIGYKNFFGQYVEDQRVKNPVATITVEPECVSAVSGSAASGVASIDIASQITDVKSHAEAVVTALTPATSTAAAAVATAVAVVAEPPPPPVIILPRANNPTGSDIEGGDRRIYNSEQIHFYNAQIKVAAKDLQNRFSKK